MRTAARPTQESGFTLVLTLVVLVLLVVSVAGLARRSVEAAMEARHARDSLQSRWALVSLRHTLRDALPRRLEEEFAQAVSDWEGEGGDPPFDGRRRTIDAVLSLGGTDIALHLADEQAKVEVNALLREEGSDGARRRIERLIEDAWDRPRVRLTPHPLDFQRQTGLPPLSGYAQVFEAFERPALGEFERSALHYLAVSSNGQLRLQLAADEALRARLEGVLRRETLELLGERRSEYPAASVDELVRSVPMSSEERIEVRRRLTDRSSAYALWLETHRGERRDLYLTVWRFDERPGDRQRTLRW